MRWMGQQRGVTTRFPWHAMSLPAQLRLCHGLEETTTCTRHHRIPVLEVVSVVVLRCKGWVRVPQNCLAERLPPPPCHALLCLDVLPSVLPLASVFGVSYISARPYEAMKRMTASAPLFTQ